MANTFIELNDTPSDYTGYGLKFVRINAAADSLVFGAVELNDLDDVQANLAYAPQGGQALIYSSAAGKWRPGTMDVYSAGNGLNKSALTLNVQAGASGGLTSNADGVYITDIANVSGTYGNAGYLPVITVNSKGQVTDVTPTQIVAEYATTITNAFVGNVIGTSGQIRVTGGTGNNSNATIDLVATGVTAATYGNATHLPQITVDTYGRIQNVDLIEIVGGGDGNVVASNTLGFANIIVSGQTTVSADRPQDSLTFVAGSGTTITTQANADIITFGVDAGAVAGEINVSDLADVDAAGITNGQVLIWNSSTSKFEAGDMAGGSGSSNVDLTDFSVITNSPSGNGSLSYNNAGVFTFTPANVQATTQTLSWNASTYQLSISGGNTVDLSVLVDDLTGLATESYVDAAIANVAPSSSYGDSNVLTLLADVSTNIVPSANNTYSLGNATNKWTELHLAGNSIYINGSTISVSGNDLLFDSAALATQTYVDNAVANVSVDLTGYATTSYVDTAIANIVDGANSALDTLSEIANALSNSNATLATVAFTGDYNDLSNRPTMTLTANTYLVYDGGNIDLSGVVGQKGDQGNVGPTGISVTNATVTGDNLIITLSDTSTLDAGNVRGPQGEVGPQGDGNAGISTAAVNGSGNLIITLNDSTTLDAGNIQGAVGAKGDTGDTGVGIVSTTIVGGNLVLNYSNTSTQDVGNIQGPKGADGIDGTSISTALVNGSGNLILTLSDANTIDAGNVRGTDGGGVLSGTSGRMAFYSSTNTISSANDLYYATSGPAAGLRSSGTIGARYLTNNINTSNKWLDVSGMNIAPGGIGAGQVGRAGDLLLHGGNNSENYLSSHGGHVLIDGGTADNTSAQGGDVYIKGGRHQNGGQNGSIYIGTANTYSIIIGSLNWPTTTGSSGQVLTTDGSGNLSWTNKTVDTNTDAQTLSLSGSNLSISGGNTVDLSGLGGGAGGIALTDLSGGTGISYSNVSGVIALANTAVTAGTYGSSTKSARITVDQQGRVTSVTEATISGGGSGSGATVERFKLNYTSAGALASTANLSAGIASVTINSATGGECTITFANGTYFLPPASIMFYGYDYTNNKYQIVPMETSMGYREVPAGGTSGSPTLFDGASQVVVKLRLREAETGASRGGFGTTTHAWIQFVMYD